MEAFNDDWNQNMGSSGCEREFINISKINFFKYLFTYCGDHSVSLRLNKYSKKNSSL